MAEARCAVVEPRVHQLQTEVDHKRSFLTDWRRSVVRRFFRTRNLIHNGLWPTSIWNLAVVVPPLSLCMVSDWELCRPLSFRLWSLAEVLHLPNGVPLVVKAGIVSGVTGFVFFVTLIYIRRFTLRTLLSYQGWMYEQPKTQSVSTVIWGLFVRCVFGHSPLLYSCQQSLPSLPVPPLKHTLDKLLESLQPLYGEESEEWKKLLVDRKEFENTLGPKLQRLLVLKSWWAPNYVTDWWEKYVYLMGRTSLLGNSNYYIMDQSYWIPSSNQAARTASVIYQYLTFKQQIDRESLEPLVIRNTIPICMAQYEKIFSTTRIPGEDIDIMQHFESYESKHLAVLRKGVIYKIDVFSRRGKLLTPSQIQKQLEWIIKDSDAQTDHMTDEEKNIPALTGLERTYWAKVRSQHFSSGINKEMLDIIEKCIFFVTLETEIYSEVSHRAHRLLCGSGSSLWYDKSFNVVSFPDGRVGLHCEHSHSDAPVLGHMAEANMTNEVLDGLFNEDGSCKSIAEDSGNVTLLTPQRLIWEVSSSLAIEINTALSLNRKAIDDLDLCVKDHDLYGKGFMKTCKVSPDAYIQMALQLTYFKNAGKFALTYESSMTRLYRHGRTETVRTLSNESIEFVRAFMDKTVQNSEKLRLLQRACAIHQDKYRDAMTGRGIDRHLFALYVVSKGMGLECDFLKNALMLPWTLSTSQQPQQQIAKSPDCNLPQYSNMLCQGGGFGPVSDAGYGVSYMIPGDSKLFFHVSAKHSTKDTNAKMFMDQLFETLREMRGILVAENGIK